MGVEFVYHQGNKETQAGGMQELMSYVEAKLMWDASLNFNELVEDFCNHYYKDAGKCYFEYFNLVRFNYAQWVEAGLHCHMVQLKFIVARLRTHIPLRLISLGLIPLRTKLQRAVSCNL